MPLFIKISCPFFSFLLNQFFLPYQQLINLNCLLQINVKTYYLSLLIIINYNTIPHTSSTVISYDSFPIPVTARNLAYHSPVHALFLASLAHPIKKTPPALLSVTQGTIVSRFHPACLVRSKFPFYDLSKPLH